MSSRLLIFVAALGMAIPAAAAGPFHFGSKDEGQRAALQADGFFEAMGPFELKLRAADLGRASLADIKRQHQASVLTWDPSVQAKVEASLARIAPRLDPYTRLLSDPIDLVYVDSSFEDGLPHTRGHAVFLPPVVGEIDSQLLDFVMAHETFHALSRAAAAHQDAIYSVIGFRPCRFTPPRALAARHITNPDAPKDTHYVTVAGKDYVPYVYGKDADITSPLQLNEQLTTRLVAVDVRNGQCESQVSADEQPVLKKASEVPAFFDVVGKDSSYVSHPEELLADNFALMITSPEKAKSPEVQQRLGRALAAALQRK